MSRHGSRHRREKDDMIALQQEQNKLLDIYWARNKYYQSELNRMQLEAKFIEKNIQEEKRRGKEMEEEFREKIGHLEKRLDNLNFSATRTPQYTRTTRKSRDRSREARKRELDAEGERIQQEIERVFAFCRSKPTINEPKFTTPPIPAPPQPKYQFIPINVPQPAQVNTLRNYQHESFSNGNHDDVINISNLISSPKQSPGALSPNISSPNNSIPKEEIEFSPVQSHDIINRNHIQNVPDKSNSHASTKQGKQEDIPPPKPRIPEVKKIEITHSDDEDSDFQFQSTHSPNVSQNIIEDRPALHFDDSESPSSFEGSLNFSDVDDIPQEHNQEIGSETFHKFGFQTQSNDILEDNHNVSETLPIQNTKLIKNPEPNLQKSNEKSEEVLSGIESIKNASQIKPTTSSDNKSVDQEININKEKITSQELSNHESKSNSEAAGDIDDFNFEDDEFNLDGWQDDMSD